MVLPREILVTVCPHCWFRSSDQASDVTPVHKTRVVRNAGTRNSPEPHETASHEEVCPGSGRRAEKVTRDERSPRMAAMAAKRLSRSVTHYSPSGYLMFANEQAA